MDLVAGKGGQVKENKFIVFDRDGTIIKHVHHLVRMSDIYFCDGIFDALNVLVAEGFQLGMATNQSVVGRGLISVEDLKRMHQWIDEKIRLATGVGFDFIEVCPHLPSDNCGCRKPKTGLLKDRILSGDITAHASFMVGDQDSDILFGNDLGLTTVQILKYRSQFSLATYTILDIGELPLVIKNHYLGKGNFVK